MRPKESLEKPQARIGVVICHPGKTPEMLEHETAHCDAIILITFATGTIPDKLVPSIHERMAEGVAFIGLSDNPHRNYGPKRLTYAAGLSSGVPVLQKVNVNGLEEVHKQILDAYAQGLRGKDLEAHIKDTYAYKEHEAPPPDDWEIAEQVAIQRSITRQTFEKIGMKDEELERAMRKWEIGV